MKKPTLPHCAVSLLLCVMLCTQLISCTARSSDTPASSDPPVPADSAATVSAAAQTASAVPPAFEKPADVVSIDLNAEDPSVEGKIAFIFDRDGTLSGYAYKSWRVTLTYRENRVTVCVTDKNDEVLALEHFTAQAPYDPSVGFCSYRGYYFAGLKFEKE